MSNKANDQAEAVQNGKNTDRLANGRFGPGNQFAKNGKGGRPKQAGDFAAKVSEIVSRNSDWDNIVKKAVKQALAGDARSREWLSDRLMGKPKTYLEANVTTMSAIDRHYVAMLAALAIEFIPEDRQDEYDEKLESLSDEWAATGSYT